MTPRTITDSAYAARVGVGGAKQSRDRRDEGAQPVRVGILGLFFSILTLIVIVVIPSKNKK